MSYYSEICLMSHLMCFYILHAHKNIYIENVRLQDVMPCCLLGMLQYFRGNCSVYAELCCVTSSTDVNMLALKIVVPPVCILY